MIILIKIFFLLIYVNKMLIFNQNNEALKLVKKLPVGIKGINVAQINNKRESKTMSLFFLYI